MWAKPMAAGLTVLTLSAIACGAGPEPAQVQESDDEGIGYTANIVHTTDGCDSSSIVHGSYKSLLPEELRRVSDLIVRGTVVSSETVYYQYRDEQGYKNCTEAIVASFKVDRYYKGDGPDTIGFLQPDETWNALVEEGVPHLLYLQRLEVKAWQEYLGNGYSPTAQAQGIWKVEGDRAIQRGISMKISDLMTLGVRRYPVRN